MGNTQDETTRGFALRDDSKPAGTARESGAGGTFHLVLGPIIGHNIRLVTKLEMSFTILLLSLQLFT